jgi:hypothetical protein
LPNASLLLCSDEGIHLQGAKVILLRYFSKYYFKKYAFLPRFLTVLLFFVPFCCNLSVLYAHFVIDE